MTSGFVSGEILLYLYPALLIYVSKEIIPRHYEGPHIRLNVALLPLLLILIHCFSTLIFSYSMVPYTLFATACILAIYLYDYIKGLERFEISKFLQSAIPIVFYTWGAMALAMGVLRIISYF